MRQSGDHSPPPPQKKPQNLWNIRKGIYCTCIMIRMENVQNVTILYDLTILIRCSSPWLCSWFNFCSIYRSATPDNVLLRNGLHHWWPKWGHCCLRMPPLKTINCCRRVGLCFALHSEGATDILKHYDYQSFITESVYYARSTSLSHWDCSS